MAYITTIKDSWAEAEQRQYRAPSAADLAARETERLARRREIKGKIAESELAEQRHAELSADLEALEAAKDQLDEDHSRAAKPIQGELGRLESMQLTAVRERRPIDQNNEDRRRELLASLYDLNAKLVADLAARDRLIGQVERDRTELARQCNTSTLQAELIQLGAPKLRIALRVAQSSRDWAQRRLDVATKHLEAGASDYWAAELAAAESSLALAVKESDAALAAILHE